MAYYESDTDRIYSQLKRIADALEELVEMGKPASVSTGDVGYDPEEIAKQMKRSSSVATWM